MPVLILRDAGQVVAISLVLAGSSKTVAAAPVNQARDLDFAVETFYYASLAAHRAAPAGQLRATQTVRTWYDRRLLASGANPADPKSLAQAGPVLEAVRADPSSMTDEMRICTERAVRDPAFDAFARALPQ